MFSVFLTFKGFGNIFGFLYVWTGFFITRPGGYGVQALTFATYLCEDFLPKDCDNEQLKGRLLVTCFMSCNLSVRMAL